MIVYKIVTEDLKSYIDVYNKLEKLNTYSIQYKVREWVYPKKGTKIFAFKEKESAISFIKYNPFKLRLFKAECKNAGFPKYISSLVLEDMRRFWSLKNSKRAIEKRIRCINLKNTVSCSSLKLLKEIPYEI